MPNTGINCIGPKESCETDIMVNILVIDDHPYMGQLVAEELADEKHHISYLDDPDYLMSSLEESRPDVVLLELYLQGVERWDLLDRIKEYDPSVQVLIMSAYNNFLDNLRLRDADGYLIKDIHLDEFKQKIFQNLVRPLSHKKSRERKEQGTGL
jgi:DNA-binding NtrC family response regulator